MNEENSNQSVVENYWAVNSELWGQAGNTGHKGRCSDDFVYFPQLASQRGLCATEGWSPLTADASTPGAGDGAESLWCVMSPGWRQGARRDIHFIFVNSLYHFSRMHKSWILLNVKEGRSMAAERWDPMAAFMFIWKEVTVNTNTITKYF